MQLTYTNLQKKTYKDLSLIKLAELIVQDSDRTALNEFHDNRELFRFGDNPAMLFADFVDSLCESCWALKLANSNYNLLEKARDHLIDRFSNIPTEQMPRALTAGIILTVFANRCTHSAGKRI